MAFALPRRRRPATLAPAVVADPPSVAPRAEPVRAEPPALVAARDARRSRWRERVAVLALALAALALRLHWLGRQSLWLDEGLSVYFARLPLAELFPTVVERDIHPPLHVLLLHFWLPLAGAGEFAVRWPSAAAGALLVPVVWALARSLFRSGGAAGGAVDPRGAVGALVAAALTAASPFLLYFSQEARNYAMLALFGTAASYALWRALAGSARAGGWWAGYAVGAALTLYTHYYGALLLLFHAAFVLLRRRSWRAFALASVAAGVMYLPWMAGLVSQLYRLWKQPDYWAGSIDLWTVLGRTFSAFTLGHQDRWAELLPLVGGLGALFVVGGALAWRGAGRVSGAGLFLVLYVLVPAGALYALTANNPKFAERYLIAVAPPVTLLLARALAEPAAWRPRRARWLGPTVAAALTSVAVAASLFAAAAVYTDPLYAKDDHRGAVAAMEAAARPGDVALLLMDTYPTYTYYSRGAVPYVGLPGALDLDVVVHDLNEVARGRSRIWALLWQAHWADPNGLLTGLLQDQATEAAVGPSFKGLTLRLFDVPPGGFTVEPPHHLSAGFEGRVEFVGFGTPNPGAVAGDALRLGLYWRSLKALPQDLRATATLRDRGGRVWGSVTAPPSGFHFATSVWEPPAMYRGQFDLPIEPGAPPGEYTVEVNLYDPATREEWRILDGAGVPVGTRLTLPLSFVVFRSEKPPEADRFASDATVGGRLAFAGRVAVEAVGVRFPNGRRVAQGDVLPVALDWRALGAVGRPGGSIRLGLTTGAGAGGPWLYADEPVPSYPVGDWAEGDILTG